MNWRRVAFWFGVVALADAMLLVAPVDLPAGPFAGVVPGVLVALLALVAAGYGVAVLARAAGEAPRRERPDAGPAGADGVERVGADVDEAFDALSADADTSWSRAGATRMLRSELRRGVVATLEARGHARDEAERLVDEGAWTDDRRAAAFLGEPTLPLSTRVRDWATGEAARRRAEAAAEELAALTASDRDGGPAGGSDDGPAPRRDARRPADELLGGPARGERTRSEREAVVEPEVDA